MWKAGPGIASQYSGIAAVIGRNYNVWTLFEKKLCMCALVGMYAAHSGCQ